MSEEGGFPVIGTISMFSVEMHPFGEFVTDTMQGLAHVSVEGEKWDAMPGPERGNHLHLLTIVAQRPGHGDCSRFLDACLAAYQAVTVYAIVSQPLRRMLERRGFTPCVRYMAAGLEEGMTWARKT